MRYTTEGDADIVLDAMLDEAQLPFRCPVHGSRPVDISCQMRGEWHSRHCNVQYGCGCKLHRTMYELRTTTVI